MKNGLLIIILLLTGISGFSQESNSSESIKDSIEKQIEALNLSENQKEDFKAINEKYKVKFEQIQASEDSRMSKFKALKSWKKEKNNEMKQLLDKEQYKLYKEFQKENQKKLKSAYKKRN